MPHVGDNTCINVQERERAQKEMLATRIKINAECKGVHMYKEELLAWCVLVYLCEGLF